MSVGQECNDAMTIIDQTSSLLQGALRAASLGFRVFPLAPLSRKPRFKDWPWQQTASSDLATVQDWWERWPDSNIAVVADKHATIIDVDRKPGKPDGWLEIGAFIDQNTPWAATPNNGYHFYYQHVLEHLRAPKGVDIQTGHKYVVAPPSSLLEGHYTWGKTPGPPWDPGLLTIPAALKNRLLDFGPYVEDQGNCPKLIENPPVMPLAELKPTHIVFLQRGVVEGFPSRSELFQSIGTRLYKLGYTNEEVLSMLLANPFVHEAAYDPEHNGSQSEVRAREWLWTGLKKVAYHRRKRPNEWALPVQTEATPKQVDFEALRDQAGRISPGEDIRPLLKQVATLELDPFEEDQILGILHRLGTAKGVLTKLMARYKAEAPREANPHAIRWKHTSGEERRPLGTVDNLELLLTSKQATVRHNLMTHRVEITYPNMDQRGEEWLNVQLAQVRSWAAEYRIPLDTVAEQLVMLAQRREYHPFREWVEAKQWDGINRLEMVLNTVKVAPEKEQIRNKLMTRWLVSIVASVWGYGNRPPRGVLTFTGPQQQGKTTWLYYLVPRGMYHQGLILRPDQRDSATKGLRYLLVEIGEIGTTFKRSDIESLKSYIGQRKDTYRLAYARDESEWTRRTVFAASANNSALLHDQSGNTRWWVLETLAFDLATMESLWSTNELQLFWAEMLMRYQAGETWDLDDRELAELDKHLEDHMELTPLANALMDTYQWQARPPVGRYPYPKRETDIRHDIKWGRQFTPSEGRELRELLKKWTGQVRPTWRRLDLATQDGKPVESDWEAAWKKADPRQAGRYWYVPPLRGSVEAQEPFKPIS